MTPQQISTPLLINKKPECNNSHGTDATWSKSSASISSGYLSPDYSTVKRDLSSDYSTIICDFSSTSSTLKRKEKRWGSTYNNSSIYWEPQSDRNVRNIMNLLIAFAILFLIQVWGLHAIAKLKPFKPWSRFSTLNPNIDWCPQATCHNSLTCRPCDRKFLIVIATGRSGSTTLTNMLDLLPGVRMAGENNGHLMYGFHAMSNLELTEDFHLHSRKEVKGAWRHHPIPEQSTTCPIQHMFESMNPPSEQEMNLRTGFDDSDEILGFKTVRFHDEEQFGKNHEKSVEFLMKTFPCARFIINIRRDVKAQKNSWLKAFGTEIDGNSIRHYNQRLENIAAQLGKERARLIDMSEWSQKDGSGLQVLNEMIEWLGFEGCQYLYLWHSNKNGYDGVTLKYSLGENCKRIGQ